MTTAWQADDIHHISFEEHSMTSNHSKLIAVALTAASLFVAPGAFAAEATAETDDLAAFTCKDIMRLSGDDREIAIALAHGYVLGKKGQTSYQPDALAELPDAVSEYCLENPTEKAQTSV
jgi:ABC-type hemin transport system substrate-binding protein